MNTKTQEKSQNINMINNSVSNYFNENQNVQYPCNNLINEFEMNFNVKNKSLSHKHITAPLKHISNSCLLTLPRSDRKVQTQFVNTPWKSIQQSNDEYMDLAYSSHMKPTGKDYFFKDSNSRLSFNTTFEDSNKNLAYRGLSTSSNSVSQKLIHQHYMNQNMYDQALGFNFNNNQVDYCRVGVSSTNSVNNVSAKYYNYMGL